MKNNVSDICSENVIASVTTDNNQFLFVPTIIPKIFHIVQAQTGGWQHSTS